jgi:hypothetical protein
LFNIILNRTNNLSNIKSTVGIIIAQLGVWRRYLRIVVSTLVPKVMEYSNMAAPIYASWGFDTDIYYEKNIR